MAADYHLFLFVGIYIFGSHGAFITPTLADYFQLSFEKIGRITSVTNLCYAIATILFGLLAVKVKRPKKWLVIFCLVTAIVSACCMFVKSYGVLLILRGAIGALEGPISPLILLLVSRAASDKTFGLDVGILNMGVAFLSFIFGPKFAIWAVIHFGWQVAFLIVSLPSIIVALVVVFTVTELHIEKETEASQHDISKASAWDLLKYRNVIVTAIVALLCMAGYWIIIAFAPMYMTVICGYTQESLGNVMFIVGWATVVYAVFIPRLSDYLGRKPVLLIFLALLAIGAFIMGFFPTQRVWSVPAIVYILIGGMTGCFGPIAWNIIPMESVPLHLKATSCGVVLGIAELIGGGLSPSLGGIIADAYGLSSAFIAVGIIVVVGFVAALFLTETLPAKVRTKESITAKVPANT